MKAIHFAQGLSLVALAGLVPALSAQTSGTSTAANVARLLDSWRVENGASWQAVGAYDSSYLRMLYGGTAKGDVAPAGDADYVALARSFVDRTGAMFGLTNAELAADSVHLLPLGTIGTTDKIAVRLAQVVNGVPVEYGSVNALFTPAGDLLALDARTIPEAGRMDTVPTVSATAALQAATADFESATGTPVTRSGDVTLNIIRSDSAAGVAPALAWRVQVWNETEGFLPESYVYQLSAQGSPSILRKDDAILHFFDVGGNVTGLATPGNKPDTATNPPVAEPMKYMTVSAQGAGTTTTDANGDFNFPGVNGPVNVTFTFTGSFNDVNNSAGGEYSLTQSLTGTGNSVVLNPTPTMLVTAQSNTFARINDMRDWTRKNDPNDATMDAINLANTNISATCNAFYDGSSTNYYQAGGGCVNTAYNSVIWHETGHWENDRYNSGNGFDGFGEGNADVFGMYQADSPIVGEDFFGPGTEVRNGTNLRQYCGDGNGGCYGEVHNDGEVLMGALWKVRAALQVTHGQQVGGDMADLLFSGWMNGYDQGTIDSIIETQWLTLDDDNGDIQDGTPNFDDIDGAFRTQGFPGVLIGGSMSSVMSRNGTGINPDVFVSTSSPILGKNWTAQLDANGIGTNGTFVFGYAFAAPLNTGLTINLGEILVDPTSPLYAQLDARILGNGLAPFSAALPADINLNALPVSVQALVPSGGTLTNALDLVLGTF